MPGLILFLGSLCVAAFYELEGRPANSADFFKFKRIRSSFAVMLLIIFTACFAGLEIWLMSQGKIYKSGIEYGGFIKLLMLILGIAGLYLANGKSAAIRKESKTLRIIIGCIAVGLIIFNLIGLYNV